MKKRELLRYLAETLSFAKALERFPSLTNDKLKSLLLEASELFEEISSKSAGQDFDTHRTDESFESQPHPPTPHSRREGGEFHGKKKPASEKLTFYIDGASRGNPGKAAIGVVVMDGGGQVIGELKRYIGETTNNMAEYQALLEALTEGKSRGGRVVNVFSDSELMVRQINGVYKVKDGKLLDLYKEAKRLISGFSDFKIDHITRDKNSRADSLANEALDNHLKGQP